MNNMPSDRVLSAFFRAKPMAKCPMNMAYSPNRQANWASTHIICGMVVQNLKCDNVILRIR